MVFDLQQRTASLSVGEFAGFCIGPHGSGSGSGGIWRAQLGTHWHNELRSRATEEHGAAAAFELPITGRIVQAGWTLTLTGRIDQVIRATGGVTLREIKTVTRPLPADESELRQAYPEYFVQLATYATLRRLRLLADDPAYQVLGDVGADGPVRAELVFVEVGSGLAQPIVLTPADEGLFRAQLDRLAEFLNLRLRARERLQHLRYRPAFATARPGQETTRAELTQLFGQQPLVFFEAPTGFGKTGVLLEFALGQLQSGHFDRVLYLTSKSTGQLQVVRTLAGMTDARPENDETPPARKAPTPPPAPGAAPTPVMVWHVRNKSEHCINPTFHCVRESCRFLADAELRWRDSGLARFYVDERHARDLDTLRAAGHAATICPYEITRAALAFNDVWLGDYNYVFAPRNRGLFFEQPGFTAARTLLLIDEAHNLPSRVADVYSHSFQTAPAFAVRDELHRLRAPASLVTQWDHWCHFLHHLRATDALPLAAEDDALHLLQSIAKLVASVPLDFAALGPETMERLWEIPSLMEELEQSALPRLWWCPRQGELALTCLDAATAIGGTLREFGGVVLASATLKPVDRFAAACGVDAPPEPEPTPAIAAPERLGKLNKRDTRKLFRHLTSAAELLRVEEARDRAQPAVLRAHTPWRDGAYDIAVDARVDTTFQHRSHHYATTANTVAALQRHAGSAIAVFFPSYAYAESLVEELAATHPGLRVVLQPRVRDLARQSAWVEQSLLTAEALFLVLGSSFAESIDALGGRVNHAMVVGPALPEVNAVQRARHAEALRQGIPRDEAFRRVYQIPGMTKVNQGLGRLVRAPGQRARVILHCRRFLDTTYADLLAPEYQGGRRLATDAALAEWLATPAGRPDSPSRFPRADSRSDDAIG